MKVMWRLLKLLGYNSEEAETTGLRDDTLFRGSSASKYLVSNEEQVEEKALPPGSRDWNYSSRLCRLDSQGTDEYKQCRVQSKKIYIFKVHQHKDFNTGS
jgi:hypothetical protein